MSTTPEPLAGDYLAAIQGRLDALRPMTWQLGSLDGDGIPRGFGPFSWVEAWDNAQLVPAIQFCNAARADIPALLGEIARLAGPRTDYRAWHDSSGINLGHYTNRVAAMSHVHATLANEEGVPTLAIELRVIWRADDPEADDTAWECWLLGPDGADDKPTGYMVSPIPVAAAYDPEADG